VQAPADRSALLPPGAFGSCHARLREFASIAVIGWPELRPAKLFHVEPPSDRPRATGGELSDLASALATRTFRGAAPSRARSWSTPAGCRQVPRGAASRSVASPQAGSDGLQGSLPP
jgi:hypothetical protein